MQVAQKITLEDLRKQHYFDIHTLAQQVGIDISVIQRILQHQPVQCYQAELFLLALNEELGEEHTLDTLDIVLFSEEDKKEL